MSSGGAEALGGSGGGAVVSGLDTGICAEANPPKRLATANAPPAIARRRGRGGRVGEKSRLTTRPARVVREWLRAKAMLFSSDAVD
jgi:hypothetical protein